MTELVVLFFGYILIGTAGLLLMKLSLIEIGPLSGKLGAPLLLLLSLLNVKFISGFACYAVSFLFSRSFCLVRP